MIVLFRMRLLLRWIDIWTLINMAGHAQARHVFALLWALLMNQLLHHLLKLVLACFSSHCIHKLLVNILLLSWSNCPMSTRTRSDQPRSDRPKVSQLRWLLHASLPRIYINGCLVILVRLLLVVIEGPTVLDPDGGRQPGDHWCHAFPWLIIMDTARPVGGRHCLWALGGLH